MMVDSTIEDGKVLNQATLHHFYDIQQLQLLSYHYFCHYRILYEILLFKAEILTSGEDGHNFIAIVFIIISYYGKAAWDFLEGLARSHCP